MTRVLVLLSGGLDSTTALAASRGRGDDVVALSVDYGQRHAEREIAAACAVAHHYDVSQEILDLTDWGRLLTGSSLTDRSVTVPHGHYADALMRSTIVPNRNATLLAAAAGVAISQGCSEVVTAVHAGDHPIYPDCRPEFIDAIDRTIDLATAGAICIDAPFVWIDKVEIARRATALHAPIGLTWSCYEGRAVHCGRCGTCVERIQAFRGAGVDDPTTYREEAA